MPIPLIAYVATAAEVVPFLAAIGVRRRLNAGLVAALIWCGWLVAMDGLGLALALQRANNHWVAYLSVPVGAALALWTLSHWQTEVVARLTIRLAIGPLLVLWGALTWFVEDLSTFSRAAGPAARIVVLAAAAYTLVAGSLHERQSLARRDWFWVTAGIALYYATGAALSPLGALLLASRPDLVRTAYSISAGLDIVALLLVAQGVRCAKGPSAP